MSESSASESNKQIVLDTLAAIARGDRAAAWERFAPEATWQRPPSLGGTGIYEGREAIFDVYFAVDDELFETGTRAYDFEILGATAEGERVAIEMRHRGRGHAGQAYETDYHVLYEVRDGRIQAVREYFDSLYMQRVFLAPSHDGRS